MKPDRHCAESVPGLLLLSPQLLSRRIRIASLKPATTAKNRFTTISPTTRIDLTRVFHPTYADIEKIKPFPTSP